MKNKIIPCLILFATAIFSIKALVMEFNSGTDYAKSLDVKNYMPDEIDFEAFTTKDVRDWFGPRTSSHQFKDVGVKLAPGKIQAIFVSVKTDKIQISYKGQIETLTGGIDGEIVIYPGKKGKMLVEYTKGDDRKLTKKQLKKIKDKVKNSEIMKKIEQDRA